MSRDHRKLNVLRSQMIWSSKCTQKLPRSPPTSVSDYGHKFGEPLFRSPQTSSRAVPAAPHATIFTS